LPGQFLSGERTPAFDTRAAVGLECPNTTSDLRAAFVDKLVFHFVVADLEDVAEDKPSVRVLISARQRDDDIGVIDAIREVDPPETLDAFA
jgi:hypothetical protein